MGFQDSLPAFMSSYSTIIAPDLTVHLIQLGNLIAKGKLPTHLSLNKRVFSSSPNQYDLRTKCEWA